jgi:hypothetical protein
VSNCLQAYVYFAKAYLDILYGGVKWQRGSIPGGRMVITLKIPECGSLWISTE